MVEREKGPTGSPCSAAIRAMVTAVKISIPVEQEMASEYSEAEIGSTVEITQGPE